MSAAYVFASGRTLEVRMLDGEGWWGASNCFGFEMPFKSDSVRTIDLRSNGYGNQYASLLLSDKGRVVWCDREATFCISGGIIRVSAAAPVSLHSGGKTLKDAFLFASRRYFPPSGKAPEALFFSAPQYNTWIELTYRQNQRDILAYARSMLDNGLPPGVLMIDDTWQAGYGDWRFEPSRFSDPKAMCDELHGMGFKIMLWLCPYVSMDIPAFRRLAWGINHDSVHRYPVKGGFIFRKGDKPPAPDRPPEPVAYKWWNGYSAHLDFTHPNANAWFREQMDALVSGYGVDGFKLDGGAIRGYEEKYASWRRGATNGEHVMEYAKFALEYPFCEFREAWGFQGKPIVVRLLDKVHNWKALQSLVPDMAAGGLLGYPFICPDMIGGGSWTSFLPGAPFDAELFIRSAQIHALCPMMQFSASPWRVLDEEGKRIVRDAVATRRKFADRFVKLAEECGRTGEPMLRNMEYMFPGRGYAGIRDQFMMGDFLLVAPQTVKGAKSRTVAVPEGTWLADDGTEVKGPAEITVDTPLSRIPHFVRKTEGFWVEDRISRCPAAPIKRPPHNRDELLEPIEHYTDSFLSQVADEGVNGLWIPVRFRELAVTPYTPEDPQAARRVERLRSTVARCARYGVKIWLLAIEPRTMEDDDPFALACPEAVGNRVWDGRRVSCLSSPATTNYITLATKSIFSRVPGLGGMICITSGERATTCFSLVGPCSDDPVPCDRCSKRPVGELYASLSKAFVDGIRGAGSDAGFLSWFYHPQNKPARAAWVGECARMTPEGATLVYNFESGSERIQCGRTRRGGDYWLSVPGPASPFKGVAAAERATGRRIGAKIQVSCSHEIATLPYVPVPGLLYRKYKAMREEGVSSVLQCWFFGGTPGIMNRAAGELSKSDFSESEEEFLLRLARRDWGEDAAEVARLWSALSDAYGEYPLSNPVQYYGPFHASCTWNFLPDITMASLARTWRPDTVPSGDLVGEALEDFSLEDLLVQAGRMCGLIERPVIAQSLAALSERYAGDPERRRDLGIMKALRNIFIGGRDALAYYHARREGIFASRLANDRAAALAATAKMREVTDRAVVLTKEMIALCEDDPRLGYHPEAERRQFTPDILRKRLSLLSVSRARLDEIEAELVAGRRWPVSRRETEGDVWKARRASDGSVVIEGVAPDGPGDVEVRAYDLCGTRTATVVTAVPDSAGRFRAVLPHEDDVKMRPAWIVIRRGKDFNNGGTKWIWPKRPEFYEPRLIQHRLTGDNFARLEY